MLLKLARQLTARKNDLAGNRVGGREAKPGSMASAPTSTDLHVLQFHFTPRIETLHVLAEYGTCNQYT